MPKICNQIGATELRRQIDTTQISAEEYAQEVINNHDANTDLNAISYLNTDLLLDAARRADKNRSTGHAGALCGVPLVIKDNINTSNYPTTAGTTALLDHQTNSCAGVIQDLEAHGGIIGAKATMHELALGITSNNHVTGAVCNPHDLTKIAGGSSGGTASAVAAGIFPVGLGTDTGGSVRIPASLCGVVGFRPTTDSYAGDGIVPICRTRDTAGPIARNVEDIVLIDSILRRKYRKSIQPLSLSDITLGIPTELFFDHLEHEVEVAMQETLQRLERAGAALVDVSFSHVWEHMHEINFVIGAYETLPDLKAYLAQHAPTITLQQLIDGIGSPDVSHYFNHQPSERVVTDQLYRAVMDTHRPVMQAQYEAVFRAHNLSAIVFPTTQVRARDIGQDEFVEINGDAVSTFTAYIRNTEPGSVLGVPGISLPCANTTSLPIGIEFDGLKGADCELLALASLIEKHATDT